MHDVERVIESLVEMAARWRKSRETPTRNELVHIIDEALKGISIVIPHAEIIDFLSKSNFIHPYNKRYYLTRKQIHEKSFEPLAPAILDGLRVKEAIIAASIQPRVAKILALLQQWRMTRSMEKMVGNKDGIDYVCDLIKTGEPLRACVHVVEFLVSEHLLERTSWGIEVVTSQPLPDSLALRTALERTSTRRELDPGEFLSAVRHLFMKWHGTEMSIKAILSASRAERISSVVGNLTVFKLIWSSPFVKRTAAGFAMFFGPWEYSMGEGFVTSTVLEFLFHGYGADQIEEYNTFITASSDAVERFWTAGKDVRVEFDIGDIRSRYESMQSRFAAVQVADPETKEPRLFHDPSPAEKALVGHLLAAHLLKEIEPGFAAAVPPLSIPEEAFKRCLSIIRRDTDILEQYIPVEGLVADLVAARIDQPPYHITIQELEDSMLAVVRGWATDPAVIAKRMVEHVRKTKIAVVRGSVIVSKIAPVDDTAFAEIVEGIASSWATRSNMTEISRNNLDAQLKDTGIVNPQQHDLAVRLLRHVGLLDESYGDKFVLQRLPLKAKAVIAAKSAMEHGVLPSLLAEVVTHVIRGLPQVTAAGFHDHLSRYNVTTAQNHILDQLVASSILERRREAKDDVIVVTHRSVNVAYIDAILGAAGLCINLPPWDASLKKTSVPRANMEPVIDDLEAVILLALPVIPEHDITSILGRADRCLVGHLGAIHYAVVAARVNAIQSKSEQRTALHGILTRIMNSEPPSAPADLLVDKDWLITGVLRPHQRAAVEFMKRERYVILADDMGLGKTIETIEFLLRERRSDNFRKALIVTPTSIQSQWMEEFAKFAPGLAVESIGGAAVTRSRQWSSEAEVHIVNYEKVVPDFDKGFVRQDAYSHVIVDEAGKIKNAWTACSRAIKELSERADSRIAITGTPIENCIDELWNIVDFVKPGFLGSQIHFNKRFAIFRRKAIFSNSDPECAAALAELRAHLKYTMIRRRKTEVAEIPGMEVVDEEVDLDPVVERQHEMTTKGLPALVSAFIGTSRQRAESRKPRQGEIFSVLSAALKLCLMPELLITSPTRNAKLERLLEIIEEDIPVGDKIVIFTTFVTVANMLASNIDNAVCIHGGIKVSDRDALLEAFKKEGGYHVLITTNIYEHGVNLQCANWVINYDMHFNYALMNQRVDRLRRMGQSRTVTVINLIAVGTVEEMFRRIHSQKHWLFCEIIEGEEMPMTFRKDLFVEALAEEYEQEDES